MKSMDFKILNRAITTDAPLQTVRYSFPPRKRAFLKCFRKFERNFPDLSCFGWSSPLFNILKSMDFIMIFCWYYY